MADLVAQITENGSTRPKPYFWYCARQDVTLHSQVVASDMADFWLGLGLPDQHRHTSLADCPTCYLAVQKAVDLYRGELLAGLSLADAAPEFEVWLSSQRQRHHQAMLQGLTDLAEAAIVQADFYAAHGFAQRQLDLDPWREIAHRQAMRALAASGQRAKAIEQYHLCRAVLAEEVGVDPEPETEALFRELLDPVAPVATATPPVLPVPTPPSPPTNLPIPLTAFIGRQGEMQTLAAYLETCRLLTLVGPGGSGKSRLAVELGRRVMDDFPDGVRLVELAEVRDARRVAHAVAQVLGVAEVVDRPLPQLLAEFLRPRTLLLILDNCEHLLLACAELSQFLLSRSPHLRMLATSREGLAIPGEQIWPVPVLSLPPEGEQDPAVLLTSPAVTLFVDRAAAHRPDFRLDADNASAVAEICRRLDGIPLALELAAARIGSLTPGQIADLLHDRFALLIRGSRTAMPRQKTLRGLIDWSYDLLSPGEQVLFRRLAIFAGGCALADIESICADPGTLASGPATIGPVTIGPATIGPDRVLDLLLRLVDKSMITVRKEMNKDMTQPRYAMLDTIRAYAWERLKQAEEGVELAARHGQRFADLIVRAEPELVGGDEITWLRHLRHEDGNLQVALDWAFGQGHPDLGIRMTGCLAYYWDAHTLLEDSERWLDMAWQQVTQRIPPQDQARLASGLGTLAWKKARYVEARRWHQQALAFYQAAEDDRGVAFSLHNLAVQQDYLGEDEEARRYLQESIQVAQMAGQTGMVAISMTTLGNHYLLRSQYTEAGPLLEQAVLLLRRNRAQRTLGYALSALLEYCHFVGKSAASWQIATELETVAQQVGDPNLVIASYVGKGFILQREGRSREAVEMYGLALQLAQTMGVNTYTAEVLEFFAFGLADLGNLSDVFLILSVCSRHRDRLQEVRSPVYQVDYDRTLSIIRTQLSDQEQDAIRAEAADLSLEHILTRALNLAGLLATDSSPSDQPDGTTPSSA